MENVTNLSHSLSRKNIHLSAWRRFSAADIILFETDINYTVIFFANCKKLTVVTPMKSSEKRSGNFFRTHKSFLVNLDYIKPTTVSTMKNL